jgi:tetratricopeptide (TPR) repeat protein
MVKRKLLPALLFSTLFASALAISSQADADKVFMRDGRVLTGRVIDQGSTVQLIRELGGLRIDKKKIERIEYDKAKASNSNEPDDIVIQTGGRIVRGHAKISPDGNFVWVYVKRKVLSRGGKKGQKKGNLADNGGSAAEAGKEAKGSIETVKVSIPRDHVREILWKGKRKKEGVPKAELTKRIKKHITNLRSGELKTRTHARKSLMKLGVFSIPLIEQIAKKTKKDDPIHPILEVIVREHKLKSVVSELAESKIRKIYERLASKNYTVRVAVLKDIVLDAPKAAPEILLHFLKYDEEPEVRALCVSQLSMLRCFNELAAVLKLPNGRMRMAAAIALGEHGILAGVPVLIDALEISDEQYRKVLSDKNADQKKRLLAQQRFTQLNQLRHLANLKLREFTGHNFGFEIFEDPKNQQLAIKKWRLWWLRDGKHILKKSSAIARGIKLNSKERKEAVRFWTRGGQLQSEFEAMKGADNRNLSGKERRQKFREVGSFYKRAIQIDPSFVPARLALAYIYYNELEKYEEARAQLKSVLNQTLDVKSKLPRRTAYLYIANIARRQGDFKEAELRLYDALKLVSEDRDSEFDMRLGLHLALGDLYMDWALVPRALSRDSSVLEAGSSKEGDKDKPQKEPKAVGSTKLKQKKIKHIDAVTRRLKNAKLAYERGLEEINRQDQGLREQAQRLIDSKSNDLRKAALLQTLRANVRQLGLRSGAFYYGVARASAALGFSRAAEQNFAMASRMNPANERFKKAAKYWKALIERRDIILRRKIARERALEKSKKKP